MISRFWYHDLIGQIADCGQVSDEFNTHVLANQCYWKSVAAATGRGPSLARSRAACFARPNRRACSQVTGSSGGRVTLDNRSFPIFPGPLFQNEARCSAFDMEIIFHSHANKTHFHNKGCAPSLILKVRVFGTRKWPIG